MPNPAKLRSAEVEAGLEEKRRASDPRYMRKSERETLERHRAAKEPAGSRSRSRSRSRERDRGRGLGISPRGGGRGGGGGPSAPASSAVGTDGAAAGGSRAGLATHKSPRDGEPRAQQPAQERAERRAEDPRVRRQPEPPARAGAKGGAFQDVGGPAGAPETAERLLFGNSPTLPLRRPDYACFPKLFRGQLLKESIAACRVSMHAVHWCSVPSVREAAHRAFQEETQLNFVCRVPTSFLRDRVHLPSGMRQSLSSKPADDCPWGQGPVVVAVVLPCQDEDADKLTRLCAWRSKDDSTSSARTQGQTGGKGARAGYCRMNMHYGNSPSDVELHVALMPSGNAYHQALAPGCAHALLVGWILQRDARDT